MSVVSVTAGTAGTDVVYEIGTTARSRPWAGGPRAHATKVTSARVTGRRAVHGP
ncbi:hypothetical protein [Streptomyces sp. NPDC090021]|uniref:hypothetical protein n=1 Tax=Streptomyces sp. NPDC090021 TaxID=3365919 RepID=UPI0037FEB91E